MKSFLAAVVLLAGTPLLMAQDWEMQLGGIRGRAIGKVAAPYVKNGEGSTIELHDGRILHAFTRHQLNQDVAPAVIAQTISADGGATWTAPSVLFTSTTGNNAMQPGFVRLHNGELGVSYSRLDSLSHATKVFRYSSDEGKTWSEEILMSPADSYWTSAHDRMLCLQSGRVLIPLHHKKVVRPEQMTTQVAYSDDNGRTWKLSPDEVSTSTMLPGFAKKFSTRSAPGFWEGSIVERADSTLLMFGRTYAGVQYQSVSTDSGIHWSKAEPTTLPSGAAPAKLARVPGTSDLLVLWNSCCVNQAEGLLGERLTLSSAISHDGGKTWHLQRDLEAITPAQAPGATAKAFDPALPYNGNRIEYPAVTFIRGNAFVTYRAQTTVGDHTEMQEYLSVLPVAWFYAGELRSLRTH
ncbi:MAG TPA: sialidase family protein [Acidobacteriaceae bacterium]|jgi:Neuraminidase (sialidase)